MKFAASFSSIAIFACMLVVGEASPAQAQTLTLDNGDTLPAKTLPYFAKRPKLLGHLRKAEKVSFAVSKAPVPCPSLYYTAWGGASPESRSLKNCNANMAKTLTDYPSGVLQKCACKNAVVGKKIVDEDSVLNDKFYSIVKLYIKNASGELTTQRGFLEYEAPKLVVQSSRLLNQEFKEICKGSIEPSMGDGGFELNCFGGAMKASGLMAISGLFSKRHSVGSAVLESGEVFAFITDLNDEEIEDNYPGFPDRKKAEPTPQVQTSDR